MSEPLLLRELHRVASGPDAVARLRPFVVELSLRGDLLDPSGEDTTTSYEVIAKGMEALLQSRPKYRWKRSTARSDLAQVRIPAGWCPVSLGDTGVYVNGIAFKPTDWGTQGRPIIRIQNLSGMNTEYNLTPLVVPPDNVADPGDLLVSWSATLDTFIWNGPQGVVNQHIFKVIPNARAVTQDFLYWLLKHEVRQLAQSQHAHGLAMMHINRGPFLGHTVVLPPLVVQDRIVAKINELMVLCDQLEAALQERELRRDSLRSASLHRLTSSERASNETVRFFLDKSPRMITKPEHIPALRRAVVDLGVQGHLTLRVTDDWPETTLDNLCSQITDGAHRTPTYVSEGVPFVSVKDFSSGRLDFSATRLIPYSEHEELVKRCKPERGDVLLGRIGTLGKPVVVDTDQEFSLFVSVGLLKPLATVIASEYLRIFLSSGLAQRQFDQIKVGGGTHTNKLNLVDLRRVSLPLPSIAEQRLIIAKVGELLAVCGELEVALLDTQAHRVRLLEALLHEALNGGNGWPAQVPTRAIRADELEPASAIRPLPIISDPQISRSHRKGRS